MKQNNNITKIVIIGVLIAIGLIYFILSSKDLNGNKSNQQMSSMNTQERQNDNVLSNIIGTTAPDFTLTKQDGSEFTLSKYRGKTVVLFFNEGSMCYPACWNQIVALGKDNRFNSDTTVTASIVVDAKSQWDKILKEQKSFQDSTILFDTKKVVSNLYNVLNNKSSMHKGVLPGHTYIIINPEGKITYAYDDSRMGINNDAIFLNIK